MAHEFESGFFVWESAWHGLGTVVREAPSIDEALHIAGLDWTVGERPLYYWRPPLSFDPQRVETHKAIVREDTGAILGVVGADWRPLQNADAFGWFEPFVEAGCTLETAGSLREGKRVWILARIPEAEGDVLPGDPVKGFLLLANGHDGTLAVSVLFTATRVVCQNTLRGALDRGEAERSMIKCRHTKNLSAALDAVSQSIDLARRTFSVSLDEYREMTRRGLGVVGLKDYVRAVLAAPPAESRMPRAWEAIERNFDSGRGADIQGVRGTVWGAYNAVTEWASHQRSRSPELSAEQGLWGAGRQIIDRAHREALELCRN